MAVLQNVFRQRFLHEKNFSNIWKCNRDTNEITFSIRTVT